MNKDFQKKGFTLIEMIISVFIFSIIMVAITGVFISTIRAQRHSLAMQHLLDQGSYVMEYISRSVRMAKKDSEPLSCLLTEKNYGWHLSYEDNSIRFLSADGGCYSFYLQGGTLYFQRGTEIPLQFTSSRINVTSFMVEITDGDDFQPFVKILLEMKIRGMTEGPTLKIQTGISQRDINM